MLDTLATPHGYSGRLIVVEGIDGSGKTTQLQLLAKWLTAMGHRVSLTEWNSSALVRTAVRTGKRKNVLTPTTFSLLHATDFADRQLYKIIPPLKAGMNVLADRYAYTAFARDVARGVNRQWVRDLYSFAIRPDLVVYFRVSVDVALKRLIARREKLKFYEAGMDMDFADRMEKEILPALSSGFIVLADRYIYTAIARACVRGVDSQWLRRLYGFAVAPHLVFYLKIDADTVARRVLDNGGISYWESGMDMKFGDDIFDNFRTYQRRLLRTYAAMSEEFGFRVLDGRMPIDTIQAELQRQVGAFLDAQPSTIDPELRSCG